MRAHLVAALLAVAALAGVLGIAAGVSRDRPKHPGLAEVVDQAVAEIAPSASGGDCPDVSRPMPINAVRVATTLLRAVRRDPEAPVPAPSGDGDVAIREVPGLLAVELDACMRAVKTPGPGWERLRNTLTG
ncbi:MAG: hypothetical protein KDC33_12520 [Thermoleophilia bacterium]|nr:hypothetical protein [Thermoleophilia bacterium]